MAVGVGSEDAGGTVEVVASVGPEAAKLLQCAVAAAVARPTRPTRGSPSRSPSINVLWSRPFTETLTDLATHLQTAVLPVEWGYVRVYRSEAQCNRALDGWLHAYNHHRSHTALNGQAPMTTLSNLAGHYT